MAETRTFTLTIDLANEAFAGTSQQEIGRILDRLASEITTYRIDPERSRIPCCYVRDMNGNQCGHWQVMPN